MVFSPEFTARFGGGDTDLETVLDAMYRNIFGRPPDVAGYKYWLATGLDRQDIIVNFTNSPEMINLIRSRGPVESWIWTSYVSLVNQYGFPYEVPRFAGGAKTATLLENTEFKQPPNTGFYRLPGAHTCPAFVDANWSVSGAVYFLDARLGPSGCASEFDRKNTQRFIDAFVIARLWQVYSGHSGDEADLEDVALCAAALLTDYLIPTQCEPTRAVTWLMNRMT